MTKEKAKKYIKGRKLEIMCELELPNKKKWKERLTREFNFLKYVSAVIEYAEEFASLTDECDLLPAPKTVEYKGYILQQSNYNYHYMIFKDEKMVCHAQYDKKLTEDEAKERIEFFIDLLSGKIKPKAVENEERKDT